MQLIQLRYWSAILAAFRGERDHQPSMRDGAYLVADSDGFIRLVGGSGADFRFNVENVTIGQMAAFASQDPTVWAAIRDYYAKKGVPVKRYDEVRLERDNRETGG